MDAVKNFAYGTVETPPSPAISGTSFVLATGEGASFPVAPFDVTMWPENSRPLNSNAEIGRCTAIAGDSLTITRAQYGTTAQDISQGFQICQSVNANLLGQLVPIADNTGGVVFENTTLITGQVVTWAALPSSEDLGESGILAFGHIGDAYPRVLILSSGSLLFSDGTYDPLTGGVGMNVSGTGLHVSGQTVLELDAVDPTSDPLRIQGVAFFAYPGNPNGHVTATAKGQYCLDDSTPGLWQASATGNSSWVSLAGAPGAPGATGPAGPALFTQVNPNTSGTITAIAGDIINVTAACTVNLPATPTIGEAILINQTTMTSGLLTISANTGQSINGGSSGGTISFNAAVLGAANVAKILLIAQSSTKWIALPFNWDANEDVYIGGTLSSNSIIVFRGLDFVTPGFGISVAEGTNAKQGVSTLVAGTKVVTNTSIGPFSRIFLTAQSLGTVTAPKALAVTSRVNGVSFTITSADATDTSIVAWEIFEPG